MTTLTRQDKIVLSNLLGARISALATHLRKPVADLPEAQATRSADLAYLAELRTISAKLDAQLESDFA